MELAALYAYSYLIGAVPTAYIIGKLVRGIDIREFGSGNVGGSNVFYNVGKGWTLPLGLFEVFVKGGSPVWIGLYVLDLERPSVSLIGAPLLAIAGHNWSLFLKFTGGRGIAVASGVLLALAYRELIVFVAIAVGGWVIFRSSGIWVLISLLLLPFWSLLFGEPMAVTWFCVGLLALVAVKRLTSNWSPFPEGVPIGLVLLNRVTKDRDISAREDWIHRRPKEKDRSVNR